MKAKRISRDEQVRLIMECRSSGLSDYQWCESNGVLPGTFYNWISRLRKAGYTIPDHASQPEIPSMCKFRMNSAPVSHQRREAHASSAYQPVTAAYY